MAKAGRGRKTYHSHLGRLAAASTLCAPQQTPRQQASKSKSRTMALSASLLHDTKHSRQGQGQPLYGSIVGCDFKAVRVRDEGWTSRSLEPLLGLCPSLLSSLTRRLSLRPGLRLLRRSPSLDFKFCYLRLLVGFRVYPSSTVDHLHYVGGVSFVSLCRTAR
jgi:hypothetical protein